MFLSTNRGLRFTLLSTAIILGACAESTGVDVASIKGVGGKTTTSSLGGSNATASGGVTATAKGGATGNGGTRPASAGATSTTALTSGGAASGSGGTGSGGILISVGGSTAATGGAAVSTIPAPQTGLGIKLSKQEASSGQTATTLVLINGGSAAVDLKSVTIRYYFTIDSWVSPVLDIDYAGSIVGSSAIKTTFVTIQPAQPKADRYIEFSFTSGSLGAGAQTEIQTRLHDSGYVAMNTSNDYSFTGTIGFTDLVTVFVSGQLAWGTEPGSAPVTGAGGASGAAGASGTAGSGAIGAGGAGTGGSVSSSAGADVGGAQAGAAGSILQ